MLNRILALACAAGVMSACTTPYQPESQSVTEDPYIWLEEARSEEALDWVRKENARTRAALTTDPRFEDLQAAALAIFEAEDRIPYVSIRPDGLYNFWQDAANPKGLVRRTSMESYRTDNPEWETLFDVDALASAENREWVYKGSNCLLPDMRYCLLSLSDGGKDAVELREYDMVAKTFVEDGFFFPEGQQSVDWIDRDTLIVARDWGPGTLTESEYPYIAKIVRRGQPLDEAEELFRGEPTDVWSGAFVVRDNRGVSQGIAAFRGTTFFEREYFWQKDGAWVRLDIPGKANLSGLIDGQLLLSLDEPWEKDGVTYPADALLSWDLDAFRADPNGAPVSLVWEPGERQTRQGASITSEAIYIGLLDNVRGRVLRYDFVDGAWQGEEVAGLPRNATIGIGSASDSRDELLLNVSDFLTPDSFLFYDGASGRLETLKTAPARFDAAGAEVRQHEATSADGTKIPYFIVLPKGAETDGTMPTLLTGYGGFQIARVPDYLGSTGKLWLEKGGAYVLANLRGGGEFGPDWHQTAMRENKQRTWDDFIAVSEDLIARGYTSPDHLGIAGGSQGGLLVGTAFTQRPDLYNAVIVSVPLFDMLRYHEIGRGASWIGEYGDPRIPEERAWIEPYSPYQKLVPGADFPKVFYVTSTADDRTHPAHGRKAAARMAANGQDYLYYEDITGGHGAGDDPKQRAEQMALRQVYLMQQLMD